MQVVGQSNAREVFDVLMIVVDEFREFLRLFTQFRGRIVMLRSLRDFGLLFIHPHVNVRIEKLGVVVGVLSNNLGNCRAPSWCQRQ